MADVSIRKARLADAERIAAVLRDTGGFPHIRAETAEATAARVKHHLTLCEAESGHSVWVAERGEAGVVGYVSVHWVPNLTSPHPEGFVSELYVADAFQHEGIGSALLAEARTDAIRRGCGSMFLLNSRQRLSYKRAFYTKAGWRELNEMACFQTDLGGETGR